MRPSFEGVGAMGGTRWSSSTSPSGALPSSNPSPVPSRLTRPHTVVRAMHELRPLGLAKAVQGHALRLIQALITAAEAAGHSGPAGQTGFAPPSHRRRRAFPREGMCRGEKGLLGHDPALRLHPVRASPLRPQRRAAAPGGLLGRRPGCRLGEQLAEIAQGVTVRGEAAARAHRAGLPGLAVCLHDLPALAVADVPGQLVAGLLHGELPVRLPPVNTMLFGSGVSTSQVRRSTMPAGVHRA